MKTRLVLILLLAMLPLTMLAKVRPLVWVLDAGHGGKDVGTEGINTQEKDVNLLIVKELKKILQKNKPGIKLVLTRESDKFIDLQRRCDIANNANADLFLSIHCNYVERQPLMHGTESFYASSSRTKDAVLLSAQKRNADKSELLAWLLQKNYFDSGRVAERGARPENYYVITHTMMPAVLTEVGFMSNMLEENYLASKQGQQEIAQTIYRALEDYYNATQKKTPAEVKKARNQARDRNYAANNRLPDPSQTTPGSRNDVPTATATATNGDVAAEVRDDGNPPLEQQWADTHEAKSKRKRNVDAPAILRGKEVPEETAAAQPTEPEAQPTEPATQPDTAQAAPAEAPAAEKKAEPKAAEPEKKAEKKAEPKPEPKPEPKEEPADSTTNVAPSLPVFSIQIAGVSTLPKEADPKFLGLKPLTFTKSGTMYKVLYGSTTDYKKAKQTLTEVRKKFPDAFIVAYLGDKLITTAEALQLAPR